MKESKRWCGCSEEKWRSWERIEWKKWEIGVNKVEGGIVKGEKGGKEGRVKGLEWMVRDWF